MTEKYNYPGSPDKKPILKLEYGIPKPLTDTRVAGYLAGKYHNTIRWWPEAKKWLVYDGTRWTSEGEWRPYPYLKEMIREFHDSAKDIHDEEQRIKTYKWILALERKQRQESILKAVAVIPEMIINSSALDCDQMLLNCKNGTIDLRTGKLQEHNPDDFITKIVDIDYLPNAPHREFMTFIDKVLDGKRVLIDYLQRFMGYCLTGKTNEQVLLFLYGTGANGKTTLANVMEKLVGDYSSTANSSLLMHRSNNTATNDLAALRGARLVKVSEFDEGERLAEATVKTLTGGDRISCRHLYCEPFEYTPSYKILLLGNYKPNVRGQDEGIWRRIHLLPFRMTIRPQDRDQNLEEKLNKELPGILYWAVEGCLEWQRIGLKAPEDIRNEVASYRRNEDVFNQWINECCVKGEEYLTSAKQLLESYKNFSQRRDITPTKLGRMLREAGFRKQTSGNVSWQGIGLLDSSDS